MIQSMRDAGVGEGYIGQMMAGYRDANGWLATSPFIIRATPILGTAIDVYELVNNTDAFIGKQLSEVVKALTSAGLTISIALPFADDIAKGFKLLVYGDNVYDYSNNTLNVVRGSFDDLTKGASNPASIAKSWQGSGAYPGIDDRSNITLKKGTKM